MRKQLGGVVHAYQKYDPAKFPSPTQPPPDLASQAFEHMLAYGDMRSLTEEELARAVRLDARQIAGLGPSIEALLAMLRERKRKILAKYETDSVHKESRQRVQRRAKKTRPPREFRQEFDRAVRREQIYDLELLWYALADDQHPFAQDLVAIMERLGERYQVNELIAKYDFSGRAPLSVPQALEVKEELEKIDELIRQLEEARENAQIGLIDMQALAEFAEPGEMSELEQLQQTIQNYVREMAERQGLERDGDAFRLTPKAHRIFQGRLLETIFSNLQAGRSGRHSGPMEGEGAVETQTTKPYEFGDSITQMDIPQSFINALVRTGPQLPLRLKQEDIEVHRTRNTPKCGTVVIMDMSGSMRYDGQYINVKRMALALDGLIRSEYPGDFLRFIEMYSFARPRRAGEIVNLMPKIPTIHDPVVRLKADMSREDISEYQVPPHFTNIQHSLQMARRQLAAHDGPNKQIILITDGLPTAHFEGSELLLLYPPDPRTEQATMREGLICRREEITINLFLVPSWSQSEEDIRFAHRLAESTGGRVIFTAGRDLDRFVIWDYVQHKRSIIG